ncbi:helix-turn-helix domain-containing protein [Sphingobium fuliginis]|uniref:Helix-turn-helix domain-containing protein n=1 Tax=Sphingobium fuliginis ATCC 27551 TaxID=1208342 RepID=A0A5B8CGQ7_SPHSA|nr:helix-turn-helix domain-containing protein [Sphingobium fuliginis]QDC37207.1 helix-turn-helix domain-containing protein [Sphingobium fuliginis ATCC 27551]
MDERSNRALVRAEPLAVRIPQAARLLGIGRSTLYQFIASGEIETIKVGRSTLIPTDTLRAFIERRRHS